MILGSKITDFINKILLNVQDKTDFIVQKSYLLSHIDKILFYFICISLVVSITASNSYCAPFLCIVSVLYFLTLLLKKGTVIKTDKCVFFLFLYFCINVASTINSTMPHASLIGLSKTTLYLIYFFAIYQYLQMKKEKLPAIACLIAVCVSFEVVVAFLQNSFDVMSAATWQDTSRLNPEQVLTRVYGTLKPSNPNLLGGYLIAAAPFLWLYTAFCFARKKKKELVAGLLFSAAVIPAILMTGCRGAYIALFVMFLIALFFGYKIIKTYYPSLYNLLQKYRNMIILWAAGIGAAVMICVPKISHRILSIFAMRSDSSTSFRMNVYQSSIQMFQDNFVLGIGCGNKVFREVYGLYMRSGFDALSAYSVLLETAVEGGILALIAYLAFIWFLLSEAVKAFFQAEMKRTKMVLTAGILSVSGVLVHGFVDTVYFRPQIQLIFWISVAMLAVYSNVKEAEFVPALEEIKENSEETESSNIEETSTENENNENNEL